MPPSSVLPNRIAPPLEFKRSSPVVIVAAPVTVRPSKPLQDTPPSKFTLPAKLLPVSPCESSTSPPNWVDPAESVETIPLEPCTELVMVLWKSTKFAVFKVIAAPVPVPKLVNAPTKVVAPVPAPVPASIVRLLPAPFRVPPNVI